jgi:long-chain acyl-CoA synthetase
MSVKEVADEALLFAKGAMKLGLCPEVDADGKMWRFMGIQSKNRKEWTITHIANMHMGCTTVAMYDTLGQDASKYVINQTELTTIAVSKDYVKKISEIKLEDDNLLREEQRMHRLKFLISFEDDVSKDDLDLADKVGIKVLTYQEVLEQGKANNEFKVVEP